MKIVLLLLFIAGAAFGQAVPDHYFDMTINGMVGSNSEPWPSTYVHTIRLWCTGTTWADMNPQPGVYYFNRLDKWLAEAGANNADVLYTFGRVPTWASSNPGLYCNSRVPVGECAPPNDLNADGTGTDQHWKDFVTAIVTHNVNGSTAHIKHWEIWNEPDTLGNWQGTVAQLVRMTADAAAIIKSLDPAATINSPAPVGEWQTNSGLPAAAAWMQQYLASGGGNYLDRIDFHSYVWKQNTPPTAEEVVPLIRSVKSVIAAYNLSNLPLWSSEGSFGTSQQGTAGISDPDLQAAFTARYLLLQRSEGLARFFWFMWDSGAGGNGDLWTPTLVTGCTTPNPGGGYLCKPGVAYENVSSWMRGADITNKCAQQAGSTIWSCTFSRTNNYVAEAIWDPSKTCSGGTCSSEAVQVPSEYLYYRTVSGYRYSINNNTVPVGAKPILLETY